MVPNCADYIYKDELMSSNTSHINSNIATTDEVMNKNLFTFADTDDTHHPFLTPN